MENDKKQRFGVRSIGGWLRGAAAGIVALAAVGLAVWEGLENRRHNRLSVVPNVDAVRDFDMREQTFRFGLLSSGLGPAVVHDLSIYLDGNMVYDKDSDSQNAWAEIYEIFRGKGLDVWDSYYIAGQYLVPGERYDLLRGDRRPGVEKIEEFRETANRINVVICYCSVYGDQCATEQLGVEPVDGGRCP